MGLSAGVDVLVVDGCEPEGDGIVMSILTELLDNFEFNLVKFQHSGLQNSSNIYITLIEIHLQHKAHDTITS